MDEIQRIILQVEGEHRVRELTKLIENEKDAITKAVEAMRQHGQLTEAQAERMGRAAQGIAAMRKEVETLNSQMGAGGAGFRDRFGAMFLGQSAGRAAGALIGGDVGGAAGMAGMAAEQMAMMSKLNPATIVAIGIASQVIQSVIQNAGAISDALAGIDVGKLKDSQSKIAGALGAWGRTEEAGRPPEQKQGQRIGEFEAWNSAGLSKALGDALAGGPGLPLNESQRQRMERAKQLDAARKFGAGTFSPLATWAGRQALDPDTFAAWQRGNVQEQFNKENIALLLTQARQGGREGEQARQTLRGIIARNPGAFSNIPGIEQFQQALGSASLPMGPEGTPGFVGPPTDLFEPQAPPFMPGRLPVGGRGFAWGNAADARIAAEAASRARKEAREAPMRAPEARDVSQLGPDAISQQIDALESAMSQAQAQGTGSAQWFARTEARLQALYGRLSALMQWQSTHQTAQQVMGQYSNMGMVWPPPN